MRWLIGLAAILTLAAAAPAPQPRELAKDVWLIPGGILPDRQPDGNTVIFAGPKGLVVMDTGRHVWQRQAILDFAAGRKQPIVAIVNSHWHLDHVSGNPDLRRAYPDLKVYASSAIDAALNGFLPRSAAQGHQYLDDSSLPPETLEDLRADLATIDNGQALRPDVVISRSAPLNLGGLTLRVNLAPNAATDGDVWVFDAKSRVLAAGDLVTLPAPFLDTACPKGWRAALETISASPFRTLVPGHGPPMDRAKFALYRTAFGTFIDCAGSDQEAKACAAGWAEAVAPLLAEGEAPRARGMAAYYVELLRKNGGKSPDCKAA